MFYLKIIKPAGLFIFALIFAASMFSASSVFAQGDDGSGRGDKPPKDAPPPKIMDENRSPEDLAKKMSGMLKEKLELSEEQSTQVYGIVLNYAEAHDRSNFDRKELDEKIATVLNEDQKEKFHDLLKNRQKLEHQHAPGDNRTEPNNEGMKTNEDLKQDNYDNPGTDSKEPGTDKQKDQMEERNRLNPEHF